MRNIQRDLSLIPAYNSFMNAERLQIRLKIKLNEIIKSRSSIQYHCVHYRKFSGWKLFTINKSKSRQFIRLFQTITSNFPTALSFFLSYYYYYYYFRIIIHNFQCNYISPLSNFENYLKVDLKVDKYNFKVLLQLLSSMIFIHRLYCFTIYFFKCKLNYTINFKKKI